MLGAPCRDCFPRADAKAPCGHDCCPKPKPDNDGKPCSWQPAGFDALETAKAQLTPEWQVAAMPEPHAGPLPVLMPALSRWTAWHGPPPTSSPASPLPLRI